MKLYEFFKGGTTQDYVGDRHQYLVTGVVIFHSVEYQTETGNKDENGNLVMRDHSSEQEYFIPYGSFDKLEITDVSDD